MSKLTISKGVNFDDPRNIKRAKKVLDLAYDLMLSPHGKKRIMAKDLYKRIGQPNTATGRYFHTMFNHIGAYTKGGSPFGYEPAVERIEQLERTYNLKSYFREYAEARGMSFQIICSCRDGDSYTRTGDRYYAWWVTLKTEFRTRLFLETHGQLFDYDIEASKPTLVLQVWREWMKLHHPIDLRLFDKCKMSTWTSLVDDRTKFRAALADQVGITVKQAKGVCQNVLNSAFASPHPENGIYKLIGYDAVIRLMDNALYQGLRTDFQVMWSYLKESSLPGETAGEYMSRQYNNLERRVMDVIEPLIDVPVWFIHDGFMTYDEVDYKSLEIRILMTTGLDVKFEMTKTTIPRENNITTIPTDDRIPSNDYMFLPEEAPGGDVEQKGHSEVTSDYMFLPGEASDYTFYSEEASDLPFYCYGT